MPRRAWLALVLPIALVGCTNVAHSGDAAVYTWDWWVPVLIGLTSILTALGGIAMFRKLRWLRLGIAVTVMGFAGLIFVTPGLCLDRVTVTPEGFHIRTGAWWKPTVKDVAFADISVIEVAVGKRSSFISKEHNLVCFRKDGDCEIVGVSDLMKYGAEDAILQAARAKGINVQQGSAPAEIAVTESPKQTFEQVVRANFPRWDQDGSGSLTAGEILRQVQNPAVVGEEAAAIAVVHHFLARPTETFTLNAIVGNASLAPEYQLAWFVIHKVNREVFAAGAPALTDFHQGWEGDCYFLASLGGSIARDAAAVKRMLTPLADGTCELKFPGSDSVIVPRPTDAEIALGSHALPQGLWPTYFEKGYGLIREQVKAAPAGQDALDVIGHGGYVDTALRLFTARQAEGINLAQEAKSADLQNRVANALEATFAAHRLACSCTADRSDLPAGIDAGHVYSVLGYHSTTRTVRIWNPLGSTFFPPGQPGLVNGYLTQGGTFEIPLDDFVQVFGWVDWEASK